ncbi:MAG: hypothetical protein WAU17_05055, partial [Nitrospirales bacterium]
GIFSIHHYAKFVLLEDLEKGSVCRWKKAFLLLSVAETKQMYTFFTKLVFDDWSLGKDCLRWWMICSLRSGFLRVC